MPKLLIALEKCRDNEVHSIDNVHCPFSYVERHQGSGFADDHKCMLLKRTISDYVEWDRDINPIPDDCPLRARKVKKDKNAPVLLCIVRGTKFILETVGDKNYLNVHTERAKITVCLNDINTSADIITQIVEINKRIQLSGLVLEKFVNLLSEYNDIKI